MTSLPPVSGMWQNFHAAEISVFAPAKCGISMVKSQSKLQVPKGKEDQHLYTVRPKYDTRYWVCRHPVDRFASMYSNKVLRRGVAPKNPGPWAEYGIKPEQVWLQVQFRYACATENGDSRLADMHWWPQSHFREYWGTKEDILIPTAALSDLFPGKAPRNKSNSEKVQLSDELREEIAEFYADDVRLYEKALKTPREAISPIIIPPKEPHDE